MSMSMIPAVSSATTTCNQAPKWTVPSSWLTSPTFSVRSTTPALTAIRSVIPIWSAFCPRPHNPRPCRRLKDEEPVMLVIKLRWLLLSLIFGATPAMAEQQTGLDMNPLRSIVFSKNLTELDQKCVSCHQEEHPGVVADWKKSRHSHVGVGCNDCHAANKGDVDAQLHAEEGLNNVYITPLVS